MTLQQESTLDAAENSLLVKVADLKVSFRKTGGQLLPVIDTASLTVHRDEAVGLVGESGSGKTMLCRALLGTLGRHAAVATAGSILCAGLNLVGAPEATWRRIRGREIGYVPQSSLAGLNPVLTIGTQLMESISCVRRMSGRELQREALELLDMVRIPRAKELLRERPHQLSGGMRQRVMIATALAQRPKLLVADEPTTALDVTTQREILTLLVKLRKELGMALILVSHDLAVIEEVCDSMVVMYAGLAVEAGPVELLTRSPRHPYTRALRVSRVDTAVRGKPLETITGEPAAVGAWPAGCRFAPRCALVQDSCRQGLQPQLRPMGRQQSACTFAERMEVQ
ncbi:MAG: ABC transporter ATP-binding protein [Chloroflexi bacterium]|nr:ABC transporter ATP-binding protein [Chloroflexota bacterium]